MSKKIEELEERGVAGDENKNTREVIENPAIKLGFTEILSSIVNSVAGYLGVVR